MGEGWGEGGGIKCEIIAKGGRVTELCSHMEREEGQTHSNGCMELHYMTIK